jgi:hypothetical protein
MGDATMTLNNKRSTDRLVDSGVGCRMWPFNVDITWRGGSGNLGLWLAV